jgi:hypothetical protein
MAAEAAGRVAIFEGPDQLITAARTALYEHSSFDVAVVHNVGAIALTQRAEETQAWTNYVKDSLAPVFQEWWTTEQGEAFYDCRTSSVVGHLDRHGPIPWHVDLPNHCRVEALTLSTRLDATPASQLTRTFWAAPLSELSLNSRGHVKASMQSAVTNLAAGHSPLHITAVQHEPDMAVLMPNHPYARIHKVTEEVHVPMLQPLATTSQGPLYTHTVISSFFLNQKNPSSM